ncbi:MAG: hypothetical protein AB8H86_34320 [Polyangiales bacterium]
MRFALLLLVFGCEFAAPQLSELPPPSDAAVPDASAPGDAGLTELHVGRLEGFSIAGLRYETPTQSGHTNEAAEYRYRQDESIRFFVGESVVAEVPAQERLTLLDFAGANELRWDNRSIRSAARFYDARLERLCELVVLFASLDDDGDPDNGVVLTPELRQLTDGRDFGYVTDDLLTFRGGWYRAMPEGDPYRVMMEAQAVFSRPHRVALVAVALHALLREVGIEVSVDGQVLSRVESAGGDSDSHWAVTYNALGYPLEVEGSSGSHAEQRRYTYSRDGYVSSSTDATSGEPLYDPTYDAAGWLVGLDTHDERVVIDRAEDGQVERLVRRNAESTAVETFAYDSERRLIFWDRSVDGSLISSGTQEFEPGLQRTIDHGFTTETRFDEYGRWVSREQRNEGMYTLITARWNDEGRFAGQLQRTENTQDGHHYLDCFELDQPEGPRRGTVTDTHDIGCDGDVEHLTRRRFGETGQLIDEHTIYEAESSWRRYVYDANDNHVLRVSDDRVESYEYAESGLGALFPEDPWRHL